MVWLAKERFIILNNKKGQSTVEYILLFLIVSVIATSVLNHPNFKAFFGNDSEFFRRLGSTIEYSYRHGKAGFKEQDQSNYSGSHDTYFNREGSHTHFFVGSDPYPAGNN